MAFVPAVPEAIAAGATLADLVLALLAMVGFVVMLGLLYGYEYTLGFVLAKIADAVDFTVPLIHINAARTIRGFDNSIKAALSAGVSTCDHAMGLFFHAAGLLIAWMANFAMRAAHDTLHLATWLVHIHIPQTVKWAVRVAFPIPWLVKLIAQEIAKVLPKVDHIAASVVTKSITVTEKIPRALDRRLTKAERRIAALAAAIAGIAGTLPLPHHFPTPGSVWRGLTKRLARLERRMGRMEKLLGVAGLAAVMANVLGLPNWRCLTRGNIGRVSRALCGLGPRAFEDLLGLLVDVLVLQNICTVITLMEDGLSLIAEPLTTWLDGAAAMFVHCNYQIVPRDPLALPYLPPVTGVALYTP